MAAIADVETLRLSTQTPIVLRVIQADETLHVNLCSMQPNIKELTRLAYDAVVDVLLNSQICLYNSVYINDHYNIIIADLLHVHGSEPHT